MTQRINVNKNTIGKNNKHGTFDPPLALRTYSDREVKTPHTTGYGHIIIVRDREGREVGRFIYNPNEPLKCGAKVWFELAEDAEAEVAL